MAEKRLQQDRRERTRPLSPGRRTGDIQKVGEGRRAWLSHRASGRPMSEFRMPVNPKASDRYFRRQGLGAATKPRVANLRPLRSIKENLVNRAPGIKAAESYLGAAKNTLAKKAAGSTVSRIAKSVFKGGTAVGLATTALDLGTGLLAIERAKREERDAKMGTAMIQSAMRQKRKPKVVKMD